jgi:glycine cleavage system H protein
MSEYLQLPIDKFIFRVATDRLYTSEGFWLKQENIEILIGVSDFFQQRNGDIAFIDLQPIGKTILPGDELISIETIKVDLSLNSSLTGVIHKINPRLGKEPEIVNQDPYGEGWLYEFSATNWAEESKELLSPERYFVLMKKEAEEEVNKT